MLPFLTSVSEAGCWNRYLPLPTLSGAFAFAIFPYYTIPTAFLCAPSCINLFNTWRPQPALCACLCKKWVQSLLLHYFCKGLEEMFPLLELRWWEVFKDKNVKRLTPIKNKWELSVCQLDLWKSFWWSLGLNQITLKTRGKCVSGEVIAWDKVLPVGGGPEWNFQCLSVSTPRDAILSLQSAFSKKFSAVAAQLLLCALLPFSFHILQVVLKINA